MLLKSSQYWYIYLSIIYIKKSYICIHKHKARIKYICFSTIHILNTWVVLMKKDMIFYLEYAFQNIVPIIGRNDVIELKDMLTKGKSKTASGGA